MIKEKNVSESEVTMTELVLPNDTNLLGNLLGGRLMHYVDIAGAMAATRHANHIVATVAVDSLEFRHPVRCGEILTIKAKLTWVGRTSMEVKVETFAENTKTGELVKANKAYITFVALNDLSEKVEVPRLLFNTEDEKRENEEAQERRNLRIQKSLKKKEK